MKQIKSRGLALGSMTALLSLGACQTPTLEHPAWSQIGKGSYTVGTSSGWAFYSADMSAAGKTGVLAGDTGTDTVGLTPRYGGALKAQYFLTDNFSLGGIVELRSFEPETASPLSAELEADPFDTIHWIGTSRYFFEPYGKDNRWKPFIGVDYSYIDEIDFGNVTVKYPAPFPSEEVNIVGESYTTIALVAGTSFLWHDNISVDMGAFYEWTDRASEVTLTFPNLGGATADVVTEPEGLIFFMGATMYF
ncbi:MAG: outer membrane protein W [Planctomycetota bacterium]|jgi:outer membrane protein W